MCRCPKFITQYSPVIKFINSRKKGLFALYLYELEFSSICYTEAPKIYVLEDKVVKLLSYGL